MKRTVLGLIVTAIITPCSFPGLIEPVQAQGVPGPPIWVPKRDGSRLGALSRLAVGTSPSLPFLQGRVQESQSGDWRSQGWGPQAGPAIDIGFFYDRLAPYGDWRQHAQWGWVWSPRGVPINWRPYTYGHWVYTDDYGWLWESDEDWGWACFHYGRWDWDDEFGWFWVPGSYWGPAWVAWRTGPGVIGWCPLPPPVRWRGRSG